MKSLLRRSAPHALLLGVFGWGCALESPDEPGSSDAGASGGGSAAFSGGTGGSGAVTGAGGDAVASGGDPLGSTGGGLVSTGGSGTGGALGTGGSAGEACTLSASGPITTTQDGQVIENLQIVSNGAKAIDVKHNEVIIRNVWIEHSTGKGIYVSADDVRIENVHVEFLSAPESGAHSSANFINIECNGGSGLTVEGARLIQGSSGIYLVNCPSSHLSWIQGFDFRGPYPRGQVVQWNNSSDGVLEDFSVVSPPGSWPEDNVNAYKSLNVTIRRGLVDGNNAPSGVGVIFDGGTSTGVVEDVDAIRMGNGCFSGYAGADDVTFRRTRCSDNICASQDGRGVPKSNSLMWAGNPEQSNQKILDSTYMNSCNGNISWPASAFSENEIEEASYTPRQPLDLHFCFD